MADETFASSDVRLALTKDDVLRSQVHVVNGVPVLATPPNWRIEVRPDLAETRFEQRDPFITESVVAADVASFLYYLGQFRNDTTQFFASQCAKDIRADIDYHTKAAAGHQGHDLHLQFKEDDRFAAWKTHAGKWLTQDQFVEFLQDRTGDLDASPSAPLTQARLLSLVKDFRATQDLICNSAVNTASGDVQLQFTKNTTQRMDATLPESLRLLLPIFRFGAPYQINGRFRFKMTENKVHFRFDLIRIENLIEQAFLDEVIDLEAKVEQKIVLLA